jgi:hypothetical protein
MQRKPRSRSFAPFRHGLQCRIRSQHRRFILAISASGTTAEGTLGVLHGVANDGIDSKERFRTLLERFALPGGLMATLGLAQFWTGQSLIDWMSLPGFTADQAFSSVHNRSGFGRWHPVGATGFASSRSVSRSPVVGVVLVLVGEMTAAFLAVPGMAGIIRGLFMGVGNDASTMSRTNSYDLAFAIANRNPLFDRGLLTFPPEYFILDNQYSGILAEPGCVGLAVTGKKLIASIWTAGKSDIHSHCFDDAQIDFGVAAALAGGATVFAFFDGLGFPMSAGMLFFTIGLARAAHWTAQLNQSNLGRMNAQANAHMKAL